MGVRSIVFGLGVALAAMAAVSPASAQLRQQAAGVGAAFSACPDPATAPQTVTTPCLAIAEFAPSVSRAERMTVIRAARAAVRFNYNIISAAAVMVPNQATYWMLAGDSRIQRLVPDRPVHAFGPPGKCSPWPDCKNGTGSGSGSGSGGSLQPIPAGVARIGAKSVWDTGNTGKDVTVAILDTGIDSTQEDLVGNHDTANSAICLGTSEAPHACIQDIGEDDNGHGTHVAGIVAAVNNDIDVVGVAPDARLESVKVLDSSGQGYDSNIIAGLQWVAQSGNPARVVNMSLGRTGNCNGDYSLPGGNTDTSAELIENAIATLAGKGIAVVVAAGNDNTKEVSQMVPAGCPGAIAVASSTADNGNNKCKVLPQGIQANTASYFTTDGPGVTVSAPGETREDTTCGTIQSKGILSLAMGGGTIEMSGTSMAAPHVTGVVALMLQVHPGCSVSQIRDNLASTATGHLTDLPIQNPYIGDFDGVYEGIVSAPDAVNASCP